MAHPAHAPGLTVLGIGYLRKHVVFADAFLVNVVSFPLTLRKTPVSGERVGS